MRDKLKTIETKRARRAKQFAPQFNIRALEAELRRENRHASISDSSYRLDYRRVDYVEGVER